MSDPYAAYVLSAYAISLGLLGGLIWRSWSRARTVRKALDRLERKS